MKSEKRRKTRRGLKKRKKEMCLVALGCNSAGLKQKTDCLMSKIQKFHPGCIFIQETKLYRKGQVKINEYQIFEHVRKDSKGGGLLLAVYEQFNPVLIYEGDDDIELLVVQGTIGKYKVRFINAYGPQEDDRLERIMGFYEKLEEEIVMATEEGCHIIIECDANAKLGHEIIKGAPNSQSSNGKVLWSLLQRNNLTVVNSLELCDGIITRHRKTKSGEEKSVLDYFIVSDGLCEYVSNMMIDERRVDVLTKYASKKGVGKIVESDHNMLMLKCNLKFTKEMKNQRVEVFDFKNQECQQRFLAETSKKQLVSCFDSQNIEENTRLFNKTFTKIVHKCFKKVRVRSRKQSPVDEMFRELDGLKRIENKDNETSARIASIESVIQQHCAEDNAHIIRDQLQNLSTLTGEFSSNLMWKVKRTVCRRATDPPMAKRDNNNNLVTSPLPLKNLYLNEYVHRLRHREIKPSLTLLKSLKEDLWERRFRLMSMVDSEDWSIGEVVKILSSLKNNKCRDPLGFSNEIFKPGVCGPDLVEAVTMLVNCSKNAVHTPDIMKLTNISHYLQK